ncbi:MAG: hypothetical protein ACPL1G_04125 [Thermodesulfovibrionales bacterium]
MNNKLLTIVSLFFIFALIIEPSSLNAGGYFLTDKDGRIISEDPEKTLIVSPTEKTIIFNDYNGTKVFDIQWDANEKTIIVKGINVYLKIYSSGKIENWTELKEGTEGEYPILIEPIIPIMPK